MIPGDRTVHAESRVRYDSAIPTEHIARYERAGKWYVETKGRPSEQARRLVTIEEAVSKALFWGRNGGIVHLDRPGGAIFSSRFRKRANGTENVTVP